MQLIISDLDNTLGNNELSISQGIRAILAYHEVADICFVTGRSLTSLTTFEPVFPEGILLSPWGGGNILKKTANGTYMALMPMIPCDVYKIPKDASLTFIDNLPLLTFNNELIVNNGSVNYHKRFVCIGGYRKVIVKENSNVNFGLYGQLFELFTPFELPRVYLVARIREQYSSIIYIGDDYCDLVCEPHVDHFLAPAGSFASKLSSATIYQDMGDLMYLLHSILISNNGTATL